MNEFPAILVRLLMKAIFLISTATLVLANISPAQMDPNDNQNLASDAEYWTQAVRPRYVPSHHIRDGVVRGKTPKPLGHVLCGAMRYGTGTMSD